MSVTCTNHDLFDTSIINITYIARVYYDTVFDIVLNSNGNTLHGMFTINIAEFVLFRSFAFRNSR